MRMIRIPQKNRIIVSGHLTGLTTSTPTNDPLRSSKPVAAGLSTVRRACVAGTSAGKQSVVSIPFASAIRAQSGHTNFRKLALANLVHARRTSFDFQPTVADFIALNFDGALLYHANRLGGTAH